MPPTPPPLAPHNRTNFTTLLRAAHANNLALVSTIRKSDSKPVALLCAMSSIRGDPERIRFVPLAVLIDTADGNPFDLFHDPTAG